MPGPTPSNPLPIPDSERKGVKKDLLTRLHCLCVVLTRTDWVGAELTTAKMFLEKRKNTGLVARGGSNSVGAA